MRAGLAKILAFRKVWTRRNNPEVDVVVAPLLEPEVNLALIVGAQRSGTTWLSHLAAANPLIAAGPESHLFCQYLHHTWHRWWTEKQYVERSGGMQGLACFLAKDEFVALLRHFSAAVLLRLTRAKPSAKLIVEKTPEHIGSLPFVRTLFPSVKVVHIIRDPRDVIASQLAAGNEDWGQGWAPADAAEGARKWAQAVEAARRDAAANPDLHYELRYEDLVSQGVPTLSGVYDFLGVSLPQHEIAWIYEQFDFKRCASGQTPAVTLTPGERRHAQTSRNFYRKGKAGGWREALSSDQVAQVNATIAPLMAGLGYA